MSPSVATRTWGRPSTADLANRRPLIILVVIGLAVGALIAPRVALPAKVPPLTIDNPSEYTMIIEASNGRDPGWSPVAIAPAGRSVVVTELVDEGANWSLRFTSQGSQFDGYQVSRADLAAAGWHYSVPDEVAARLRTAGVPASP